MAPTSTAERLKKIAKAASGFIYVVSVAGVTGERQAFDSRLEKTVAELRKQSKLPLAIGFGISSPEGAQQAARLADGVVVAEHHPEGRARWPGSRQRRACRPGAHQAPD